MRQNQWGIILAGLILIGLCFNLNAETAKLDTIITEARYVMGDNDSKAEAREYAILEAKRNILEQAGTFIKAHDVVQNYVLTEQEIESFTIGLIQTEILEERMEPSGETFIMLVKIRGVINPQEVREMAEEMQQQDDVSDELKQLQANYALLVQQMDSLKEVSGEPSATSVASSEIHEQRQTMLRPGGAPMIKSRAEGLAELNRLESLMVLIAESNKKAPNLQRIAQLTQQIMENHPEMGIVQGYLGIAYLKNGQYRPAVKNLEAAVASEDPVSGSSQTIPAGLKQSYRQTKALFHFHLAQAYNKLGQKKLAAKNLREARQLNPKSKRFQEERVRSRR